MLPSLPPGGNKWNRLNARQPGRRTPEVVLDLLESATRLATLYEIEDCLEAVQDLLLSGKWPSWIARIRVPPRDMAVDVVQEALLGNRDNHPPISESFPSFNAQLTEWGLEVTIDDFHLMDKDLAATVRVALITDLPPAEQDFKERVLSAPHELLVAYFGRHRADTPKQWRLLPGAMRHYAGMAGCQIANETGLDGP